MVGYLSSTGFYIFSDKFMKRPELEGKHFLDEIYGKQPVQIDIFVDGSWVNKGKNNPKEAGGWAAHIVETYANGRTKAWTASGPSPEGVVDSRMAEQAAAIQGLQAVLQRQRYRAGGTLVPIVLYTDQERCPGQVAAIIKQKTYEQSATLLDQLARLVEETGTEVRYAAYDKAGGRIPNPHYRPEMRIVDMLANHEAWVERLIRQKYIIFPGHRIDLPKHNDPDQEREDAHQLLRYRLSEHLGDQYPGRGR